MRTLYLTFFFVGLALALPHEPETIGRKKDAWDYDVTMNDLLSGSVLPGGDALLATEDDGSGKDDGEGGDCTDRIVPNGKIGFKLFTGEFVTKWKALALHRKGSPNTYRLINEIEGNQNFMTVTIDQLDLQFNYDLCLWKESGGLFPSKDNIYRIVDADTALVPGRMYNLFWFRDAESFTNRH